MEVDWDLHAVVRGCTLAASADPPPPQQQPCLFSIQQADELTDELGFVGDSFFSDNTLDQLFRFDLLKTVDDAPQPILPAPVDRPVLISPPLLAEPKREEILKQQVSSCNLFQPRNSTASATPPPLRSKRRRKNQMKKVCQVPAEGLSSDDTWSWRKYGQKPIKGSPYPRGYYRCSSSKGCPARKQVERNRSDPNMFIVTYSAEHNHPAPTHRNSLAGTTRHQHNKIINRPSLPVTVPSKLTTTTTASSSSVPTSDDDADVQQSIKTEENQLDDMMQWFEVDEEEKKNVLLLDDDFFDGLDCEIGVGGDVSWLANSRGM